MVILGVFLFVMDVLLIVSVIFGGSGGGGTLEGCTGKEQDRGRKRCIQ